MPPSLLIGIDLLTFTTPASGTFLGIHSLPPGWHFLFASSTSSVSTREGFWFYIPTPSEAPASPLIIRKWHNESGSLQPCEDDAKSKTVVGQLLNDKAKWELAVTPYRQTIDPPPWPSLTSHLTVPILRTFTSSSTFNISTTSCAPQDREPIPGLDNAEIDAALGERELTVLGIDLKRTWPEGAVGRERTEAAMDRSWALEDVERRWWERWRQSTELRREVEAGKEDPTATEQRVLKNGRVLKAAEPTPGFGHATLAHLQLSFLMLLTLQNWSCLQEWKRILGLVLTCKTAVLTHPTFFSKFLDLLRLQLERMDDVEGGLFDMLDAFPSFTPSGAGDGIGGGHTGAGGSGGGGNYLFALLKGFRRTVSELLPDVDREDDTTIKGVCAALDSAETFCTEAYGWEFLHDGASTQLRSGVFELEDGETVNLDMQRDVGQEEFEETGDWAPVVVEF